MRPRRGGRRRARAIAAAGRLPRGGPVVDAPLVAAPGPRHDEGAKVPIEEGRTAAGTGSETPAKARPSAVDGRRSVEPSKAEARAEGGARVAVATPVRGCRSPIPVERRHGLVRRPIVAEAARHDGARRREGRVRQALTARGVRADRAWPLRRDRGPAERPRAVGRLR